LSDPIRADDLPFLVEKALEALEIHREEINSLNVFPVPDGDTGTNMFLTVQAVMEEIRKVGPADMAGVCRAISRGSLMGARGNSGVVLSQILKGFCEVLQEHREVGVGEMARALARGSEVAYRAVMRPVEGTILTVVREAAEEGEKLAAEAPSLQEWLRGVIARARQALELTPELLPVLKEAGVVDAGGRGLVVFLEGFLAGLSGEELERGARVEAVLAAQEVPTAEEEGRYEIQFVLRCRDFCAHEFREKLGSLGTSVLVVGGDRTWRVHVHTDELGKVIEEASRIGRLTQVEVTDLREQVEERSRSREGQERQVGLVAVAVGEGIKQVLKSMGVDIIVNGGQSMNPSTAEMLMAIEELPQREVLVIPNNKNIIPAAQQTRELTEKVVGVVPARAITEGFASLVAFDPRGGWEENLQNMTRACEGVRTGAVTRAVRDSRSEVGKVRKGDYIGLYGGRIVSAGKELGRTTIDLIQAMVDGDTEIITFIVGEEADPESREAVLAALRETGLEVEVIEGGQPVYHYIVGAE